MKSIDQNAFIRMPKSLIYGDKYRFLSVYAKLLYALMADRASLSLSNEWVDRNGRVFIYFTIREICETLLCAHDKACRVLTELEEFKLIERQKQGQGNPTMIYVLPVETSENQNRRHFGITKKSRPKACSHKNNHQMKIECPYRTTQIRYEHSKWSEWRDSRTRRFAFGSP